MDDVLRGALCVVALLVVGAVLTGCGDDCGKVTAPVVVEQPCDDDDEQGFDCPDVWGRGARPDSFPPVKP